MRLHPRQIKQNDIFYESFNHEDHMVMCMEEPREEQLGNGRWQWTGKVLLTGKIITYLLDEQYPQYGPQLYDTPHYSLPI